MTVCASLIAAAATLALFVPAAFSSPTPQHVVSAPPTAKVRNGTIVGAHSASYDQDFFLGVPYAQPPVGPLRLRNPASLTATFGTRAATKYSPSCVGYGSDDWGYELAEDCLALNVVRPAGCEEEAKLPVAVWIHGGGYTEGGGADRRYNLSFIVANAAQMGKPIIGVSINYRLAQWGFLSGDAIQKEGTANLGLKDQRLALHWLRENIAGFGGDPNKVTIWGESAGGGSVGYHALLFGGRDDKLFRAIIAESLYINPNSGNTTGSEAVYQKVTAAAGCASSADSLDCLRKVPFEQLNAAFNASSAGVGLGPVLDGDLLQEYNSLQLNSGKFVRVPFLIGTNTDEGTAFGVMGINSDAELAASIAKVGPDAGTIAKLEELYPDVPSLGIPATYQTRPQPGSFLGTQWKRSAAFFGDYVMHSLRRQINQQWTKFGARSYAYRFNALPNGLPNYIGVTHFQEVAFVFDNTNNYGYGEPISAPPFQDKSAAYIELAKLMSRMWVSFVHDLDPNHSGVHGTAHWPQYSASSPQDFVFDANVTSHAEADTYRAKGIQYIIKKSASQFHR